jgi:regulator of protease activity HflC (stomatin/prohibitin superfamily)
MSSIADAQVRNAYLEQVVQEKAQLEEDLRVRGRKRAAMVPAQRSQIVEPMPQGLGVRITGFWRWKNVIVPPSCYVVHTRRGREEPLHMGLGVSFRFDPMTDAFLVVPAAMQTIIIHANCICKERQGIVVQGYVQWIIDDFGTAYRKLDLTDPDEPMRVVNVQLREQAEAAIKDKVATMSIDEVLADKQPIIQELTARLRHVAEGEGDGEGLGLRIVTVQIKEALQRPFRAERSKEARLAELSAEAHVSEREVESRRKTDAMEIEATAARNELEAKAAEDRFEREQAARVRRVELEAEALEETMAHQRRKLELEAELERMRLELEAAAERIRIETERLRGEQEIALAAARRKVENDVSPEAVRMAMIERLPEVVRELPKPAELKTIAIGSDAANGIATALGGILKTVRDA